MFEFEIIRLWEKFSESPSDTVTKEFWPKAFDIYAHNNRYGKLNNYRQYKSYSPKKNADNISEMEETMKPLITEIIKNGWKHYVENTLQEILYTLDYMRHND